VPWAWQLFRRRGFDKKTGKEVDWGHVIKGYEYRKGEFVALADADFKRANVKASETIQIDTFCAAAQIPTIYYERPYYLVPAKGGAFKRKSATRRPIPSRSRRN
jgi:non-homologous end joining protein Ku